MKHSVNISTNLPEQRQAALAYLNYGGERNKTFAGATGLTGKRAHKLLKRARRERREGRGA